MNKKTALCTIVCALASLAMSAEKDSASGKEREKPVSARLCATLAENHASGALLYGDASLVAWTNAIDSLDEKHMVFLASDLERLSDSADKIGEAMERGDFTFARDAHALFCKRLAECMDFATNRLAKAEWNFSGEGEYLVERSGAAWPVDAAEREKLWMESLASDVLDAYLADEEAGVKAAADKIAEFLAEEYADATGKSDEIVCEDFLRSIARTYDAHTNFMPKQIYKIFRQQMDLEFCGIGAQWEREGDAVKVTRIMPGGPLAKDGRVRVGDLITAISKDAEAPAVPFAGMQTPEIVELFQGEKGSPVLLEVRHPDGTEESCRIVRDKVSLDNNRAFSRIDSVKAGPRTVKVGYLMLPSFYASDGGDNGAAASCSFDVETELKKLAAAGVEGILFDLRDNPGGSLADAVKIISNFIDGGPAVRMKGRSAEVSLPAAPGNVVCDKPLAVLVGKGSASAGELVPATLQDYSRAVIIGDSRTFGKGTAQTVIEFEKGRDGAVAVTEGRFYRITGGSTQFKGVEPDVLLPSLCESHGYEGEAGLKFALPWNSIEGERYEPAWDLRKFAPELSRRSAARLASSPEWSKHVELFNAATAAATAKRLPMNLERRKTMRELGEEANEEYERLEKLKEEESRNARKPGEDIVLDEALAILGDLVELNGGRILPPHKQVEPDSTMFLDDIEGF